MTFGERLRKARRERLLTQEQLATLIGTNRRSIIYYESDEVEPKVSALKALVKALNVTYDALLSDDHSD